jgi:hypothetical protein
VKYWCAPVQDIPILGIQITKHRISHSDSAHMVFKRNLMTIDLL